MELATGRRWRIHRGILALMLLAVWTGAVGELRGAAGVLMDRCGNSLDRALLLAEMLRTVGFEARLARGELPEKQASELLAKVTQSSATRPSDNATATPTSIDPAAAQRLQSLAQEMEAQSEHLATQAAQRVAQHAPALAEALRGTTTKPSDDAANALAAAREHWWVQLSQNGQWTDLDPTMADAKPGAPLVPASSTEPLGENDGKLHVPQDLCHELTIRVVAEKRTGSGLEKTTVL